MVSRKILLTPIGLSLPPPSPPPPLSIESSTHFFADARSQSNYNQLKTTSIIMLLLILAIVFLLSMSLHLLLRLLDRKRENANTTSDEFRTESPERQPAEYRPHDEQQNPQQRSNGISRNNLVDSLPVFSFGSVNRRSNNQRLDCAVCLSPFQSDDRLRLLPYCTHAFHADCIGTWLLTNTTCPLCRSDLTAVPSSIAVVGQAAAANDREETESVKSSVGGRSFRIELGSVSGRSIAGGGGSRRTYSMGSFEYVVPESSMPEVFLADQEKSYGGVYGRGEPYSVERVGVYLPESKVVDSGGVGGTSQNWLRDYLERIVTSSTSSFSMRTASFRSINEGRSRRIDAIPANRLEAESQSGRLMAAAESFLLFLRSDM